MQNMILNKHANVYAEWAICVAITVIKVSKTIL